MYTVFFDNRHMVLQSRTEKLHNADLVLNLEGNEDAAILQSIVDAFSDNNKTISVCLRSNAIEKTWDMFRSLFQEVSAAGGIVYNKDGKLLMIYRNGKWDLPKGKLDKGEDFATAAIREVEEECGISDLKIIKQVPTIYHTYQQKGKFWLKETVWYEMSSDYRGELKPQTEEGISDVKWLSRKEVIAAMENTWTSIKSLLKQELEKQ